jgi:hypothetical protein
MEAVGGFTADRAVGTGPGGLVSARDGGFVSLGATALQPLPAETDAVDAAMAVLESEGVTAEDTALWGFGQSADFADRACQVVCVRGEVFLLV